MLCLEKLILITALRVGLLNIDLFPLMQSFADSSTGNFN